MEWTDSGFVLRARPFSDSSVILELMTRGHGRFAAMFKGGASKTKAALIQPGNAVTATWKARLGDQLGFFACVELDEAHGARAGAEGPGLYCLAALTGLLAQGAPERSPLPLVFEASETVLRHVDAADFWPALLARWEGAFLANLGYGLDLSQCAATGAAKDLCYVSPRSGRAVSRDAGAPYHDKLLALPAFLIDADAVIAPGDVGAAFALFGFFLERRVFDPSGFGLPPARGRMIEHLARTGRL